MSDRDCEECGGRGYFDDGPKCSYWSCDSCGGCFDKVKCETCDGAGVIDDEFEEE